VVYALLGFSSRDAGRVTVMRAGRFPTAIGTFAAAVTSLQTGMALTITSFLVRGVDPTLLAFLRYGLALACALPLFGRLSIKPRSVFGLLAMGTVAGAQFGGVNVLYAIALQSISSASAALIFSLYPLCTMAIGSIFKVEKATVQTAIGVVLAVFGVSVSLGSEVVINITGVLPVGYLFALVGVLLAAATGVLMRTFLNTASPGEVAASGLFGSTALLGAVSVIVGSLPNIVIIEPFDWILIGVITISSALAQYVWIWALSRSSATSVSVTVGIAPVTSMILGSLFLEEQLPDGLVAGIVLLVCGLCLCAFDEHARGRKQIKS
jgi:drug/metabolite transporter (DMT)-like permease